MVKNSSQNSGGSYLYAVYYYDVQHPLVTQVTTLMDGNNNMLKNDKHK